MKVAIIGSREFDDYPFLKSIWKCYFEHRNIECIISGGARGADLAGKKLAKEYGYKYVEFLPDWDTYGKQAGFLRNQDIIKNTDTILALWNGESNGTRHSLGLAKKMKKPTFIFYF